MGKRNRSPSLISPTLTKFAGPSSQGSQSSKAKASKPKRRDVPSVHEHGKGMVVVDRVGLGLATDLANANGTDGPIGPRKIADLFPFQEIFLRILSFLPPGDLANVQSVSRYWAKMSVDQQLWKRLYLSRYPHPHHSRLLYTPLASSPGPGPTTPRSLRPIARLPSRAFPPPSPSPSRSRSPSLSSFTDTSAFQTPEKVGSDDRSVTRGKGMGHATPLDSRGDSSVSVPVSGPEVGYGVRNDGVDWKMMLRLGTNWSNGNAASQSTISLPPSPSPSAASLAPKIHDHPPQHGLAKPAYTEQHIALCPSFIFTSSPDSPLVQVHPASQPRSSSHDQSAVLATASRPLGIIPPPPGWSSPSRPDNITAICADQSVVPNDEDEGGSGTGRGRASIPARLAVFYGSGGFVVLSVRMDTGGISWRREAIHPPHSRPVRSRRRPTTYVAVQGDPVVLATLHWPIVLTCTQAFHLSVYSLTPDPKPIAGTDTAAVAGAGAGDAIRPRHLQTMHSDVSFHPAALTLFPHSAAETDRSGPHDSEGHFRAALTYCTPLYPYSWTVAVQEFNLDLSPSSPETERVRRGECYHVGNGESGDADALVWPRTVRPLVGVKGSAVGIGSDGRWCVLAGEDNQIQVYSLPDSASAYPLASLPRDTLPRDQNQYQSTSTTAKTKREERQPPIVHSQTLLAHNAAVTSLSLSAGRCVSAGKDGRVLVWELDEADHLNHMDHLEHEQGRVGRTVGYVEVRPGGRRQVWRGAAGPLPLPESSTAAASAKAGYDEDGLMMDSEFDLDLDLEFELPHPQSISSAARSLFLPPPPLPSPSPSTKLSISAMSTNPNPTLPPPLTLKNLTAKRERDESERASIRHLAFDEEKIVGLVASGDGAGNSIRVWNFN